MPKYRGCVAIALLLATSSFVSPPILWADDVDISALIQQVAQGSFDEQIQAAGELAAIRDERIPEMAKARLVLEDDFHSQLALHFVLACHGERESIQPLIESLHDGGHYGAQYLRWLADEEYGWDIELWQTWLEDHPEAEYKDFIENRWRQQAMREGFDELPTREAWRLFQSGIDKLQSDGDRVAAAALFREIADDYPDTYYTDQSRELAELLDAMIVEDEAFEQPTDPSALELNEQLELHIYHLRDVVAYQVSQPGYCHVLSSYPFLDEYNAANALRDIGTPAIPALVELLDDRRPIRGVGYFRNFHPERTVLRYQDAAVQILEAITERELYDRPFLSSYLSDESETTREMVITRIKDMLDASED